MKNILIALMLGLAVAPASAQSPQPGIPGAPPPPLTPRGQPVAPPEQIAPPADNGASGSTTGGTLSDRLSRDRGTLTPPAHVDPDMTVQPPARSGAMPVIPPPGSPGGNQSVVPK